MAGVDSAGLGEVIQSLIPSFIESRSRQGTLDFVDDRREVIQVRLMGFSLGLILILQSIPERVPNRTTFCYPWST